MMDLDAKDWDNQVVGAKEAVLVVWHDACVWCKKLDPELAEVAKEFSGKLKFARFNIFSNDENSKTAEKYGIMGTPTMLLFCKGRVVSSLVGYIPRAKLKQKIEEIIDTYHDCFAHSTPVTS
jgi:thioredoxin 1